MTGLRSKLLLAAVAAGVIFAATPSSALVAWQCTAKDSRGKTYSQQVWGFLTLDTKPGAYSWTMDKCEKQSRRPASCKVVSCVKTHQ